MTKKHEITREDVLSFEAYEKIRADRRRDISAIKKNRRVAVGPYATFYFESFDTMWWQIHEMLYIEKGGEEQIIDELAAYNPLIPKGKELVATLMFEIENPGRRNKFLSKIGGVEKMIILQVGKEKMEAVPEVDVERSTENGKASSVHFLHFPFMESTIAAFRNQETEVILGIQHERYTHTAKLPDNIHAALTRDFG